MDDDRLASELQRRASGASPRPDWAQRDLLPAVWREIDARPQRVLASRWSPLAGLATLVVALLVLVVAVPRLVPQPPSATSTPSGATRVLDVNQFYSLLTTDQLQFKTVLVNGRIGEPDPRFGPAVCPDGRCYLGPLEGTPRPVDVVAQHSYPTMEGPDATEIVQHGLPGSHPWQWYRSPKAPFEGTLLLSVDMWRNVEFLGVAREADQSLSWSIADAMALDVNTLGRDEVVLVDGWLGGFTYARCLEFQFPPLEGLPTRDCSGERIASEEQSEGQPVLRVQPGAYADFAPNPTTENQHEPRQATYAVAPRLEGWCASGNPPCWQWTVVARVDATSEAAPSPSPSVPPSPSSTPTTIECGDHLVSDLTGLIAGCTSDVLLEADAAEGVSNPRSDESRLRIVWWNSSGPDAGVCASDRKLRFERSGDGYRVVIERARVILPQTTPLIACTSAAYRLVVEIALSAPVSANDVALAFEIQVEPERSPSPSTSPVQTAAPTEQARLIECTALQDSGILSGYGPATIHDETGLVESCERIAPTSPPGTYTVFNPDGNLRVLQLHWGSSLCDARADFNLRRATGASGFTLEGTTYNVPCRAALVAHEIRLRLSGDVNAEDLLVWWNRWDSPAPTPSPLEPGSRILNCPSSEALGDPGISIVDHSGRIGGCSMAQADTIPEGPVGISTTGLPLQLAVDWVVNTGCPGDYSMEFWGPVDVPLGFDEYVLRIARTSLNGATCNDVTTVRRVRLGFTESVEPSDILAFVADEFDFANSNSSQVGATTTEGLFDLLLVAPQNDFEASEPIDVTAELIYEGAADSVTLSGHWSPAIRFMSLTGGPILYPYGSLLLCPDHEVELQRGVGLQTHFARPDPPASGDPNNAYYDQYMFDGQFRLPPGTYLISTGVGFNVGSDCQGENVGLSTSIVIHVR